jgi:predicted transposase YbfD/YdcC
MSELEEMAGKFLGALKSHDELLNLDGKTLCGTIPAGQTKGAHLLSLYQAETGLVLQQRSVGREENEISAAPELLAKVNLQGRIVTGDALLAQRKLSRRIVKAGGDFLWTIKDNQPLTHRAIADLFTAERAARGPLTHDFRTAQEWDKGHGRIERRKLTTSSLLNGYLKWPFLGQVFELERQITEARTQQTRLEKVCGLTSLSAAKADPGRLLQLTRGHWSIENGLHYRRDVTLGEDRCRMKSHTGAEALAVLNNLTLGLIRHAGWTNLAAARRYYAARRGAALQLIIRAPN